MAQAAATQVDNQFIQGLKTEFTGLNFPDKACIETYDCVFDRTGLVSRRKGFDYESAGTLNTIDRDLLAISKYYWENVSGDGSVSLLVKQVGTTIYFYNTTNATVASPLSNHKLVSTVNLSSFLASGSVSVDGTKECQYADGNGYLFIFHPNIDSIYVDYNAGTLTGTAITLRIRDFTGIVETGVEDTFRPATLTDNHSYNLGNQGWGKRWSGTSVTSTQIPAEADIPEPVTMTITTGLPVAVGDRIRVYNDVPGSIGGDLLTKFMVGTVTAYDSGTGVVTMDVSSAAGYGETLANWKVTPQPSRVNHWKEVIGNYPSNSDVWWYYKDENDTFDPKQTIDNIPLGAGAAPKGFFILDAFNQNRSTASGISGLTTTTSNGIRPSTGAWYQGRVWYSGVHTKGFSEDIYFSQIIENTSQFGKTHQVNDPTSSERFDLLPSDGGKVRIQGTGSIRKLFPIVNGMLVFADRGIWFVTGSQGIGFTANDYTITKISEISTLSASSFVNVKGLPMWWNKEGIYTVIPQQGSLQVQSLTDTTISSFYNDIPVRNKIYARGYYDPINFIVQWLYKDIDETNVTTRYSFSNILNLNVETGAFYPWIISPGVTINDIIVLGDDGNLTSPPTMFKYICSIPNADTWQFTFAEEKDTNYIDWETPLVGIDYESYFITGYRVYTEAHKSGQLPYISVHADSELQSQCKLQAMWDFTTSGNTGKWSSTQLLNFNGINRKYQTKKVRIPGMGRAVQLKFLSVPGEAMSLIGWSTVVSVNRIV